jgi:hypothetical protein
MTHRAKPTKPKDSLIEMSPESHKGCYRNGELKALKKSTGEFSKIKNGSP